MSDIRKFLEIMNESSAGTSVSGSVASIAQPMSTERRVEEETKTEKAPPVIEYGNWENSALTTSSKLKKQRAKAAKVVKSIYGEDSSDKKVAESKLKKKSKPIAESHLDEQDLIINPSIKPRIMPGLIGKGTSRVDHEVQMAKGDLLQTAKNAASIFDMIKDRSEDQGLEGWVQEKITKAEDYLNAVKGYLEGTQLSTESVDGNTPGTHMFASEQGVSEGEKDLDREANQLLSILGVRPPVEPNPKLWSDLPRAPLINHIIASAKNYPQQWAEAMQECLDMHRWYDSYERADNTRLQPSNHAEREIYSALQRKINMDRTLPSMARRAVDAAMKVLCSPIYGESGEIDRVLKTPSEDVYMKALTTGMPAPVAMLPAVKAFEKIKALGKTAKNKQQGVAEGMDPTTDSARDARGDHSGEVKKNKDGSYVATNQSGSRKIFKSEKAAEAHAKSGKEGVAEGSEQGTKMSKTCARCGGSLFRFPNTIKCHKCNQTWKASPKNKEQGVAEGSMPYPHGKPEAGDKITWYHSNHYPEIEGTVVGWKDGSLIVQSVDPSSRNTEKTVAKYRVPKNNILSVKKQGVAEGSIGDKIKGTAKSVKRASQGWGVGAAPDMITPAGAVSAFKNMDGQRLANFVASRKDQSKPRKDSAGAFVDKVIDREMRQRGYGRVADKDEQGVAEARMSAALRMSNAVDKQRAKSAASSARTPSSIPKPEPKVEPKANSKKA